MKILYSFLLLSVLNIILVFSAPTTSLQFDGTSTSYIDCGSKSQYSQVQFTIEAWIYYQTLNDGYIISNEGWGTGAQGFTLHTSGSKLEFIIGSNANWIKLKSISNISINTWYHVAATYSSGAMNIYINGVLDNTSVISGSPMVTSTQNLCIGEGAMWKGREMTGEMSDVRLWNKVRSTTEINSTMSTTLFGNEPGLVANWKMDEGNGIAVAEATGNYSVIKPDAVIWHSSVETEIGIIAPIKGLVFNGLTNCMVDFGQSADISSPTQFTVETLVNFTTLTGGYILSSEGWSDTNGNQGFSLRLYNNKLNFVIGSKTSWTEINAPSITSLNKWIHIAATYSSSSMKLYINGLEVATLNNPGAMSFSTQNLILGEGSMWKGRRLTGKLGYVRMWNTVRTKSQIRDYANQYTLGNESNLLASWNNNVISTTILPDSKSTYQVVSDASKCYTRGKENFDLINFNYKLSNGLYKEDYPAQAGEPANSYLWPYAGLVTGAATLMQAGYNVNLDVLADNVQKYYSTGKNGNTLGGYNSGTNATSGQGTRFYDDNAIVGISLLEAYNLTKLQRFLDRAGQIVTFLKSGVDTKLGGGMWWNEDEINIAGDGNSNKPACANGYATLFLLEYYTVCPISQKTSVLDFAKAEYTWLKTYLRDPVDNCYWNDINTAGIISKTKWTYNTGVMIQNGVRLYKITGDQSYLNEAIESAQGAYDSFVTTLNNTNSSYPDHDPWFNTKLLRGFIDLAPYYTNADSYIQAYYKFINNGYDKARTTSGFFFEDWTGASQKRYYSLLMQDAVVESYGALYTYLKSSDIKSNCYPGNMGTDLQWFGFITDTKNVPENSYKIDATFRNNTLRVVNNTGSKLEIYVYNVSGIKIIATNLNAVSVFEKQLQNMNGYFILKCIASDGTGCTKKFIVTQNMY